MIVGYRFFHEGLYMYITAFIVLAGITLASHASGTMFVEGIKILVNYFLRHLLPVLCHRKRHNIPDHKAFGFGWNRR